MDSKTTFVTVNHLYGIWLLHIKANSKTTFVTVNQAALNPVK